MVLYGTNAHSHTHLYHLIISPYKLDSHFIVQQLWLLHTGGKLYLIIHFSLELIAKAWKTFKLPHDFQNTNRKAYQSRMSWTNNAFHYWDPCLWLSNVNSGSADPLWGGVVALILDKEISPHIGTFPVADGKTPTTTDGSQAHLATAVEGAVHGTWCAGSKPAKDYKSFPPHSWKLSWGVENSKISCLCWVEKFSEFLFLIKRNSMYIPQHEWLVADDTFTLPNSTIINWYMYYHVDDHMI